MKRLKLSVLYLDSKGFKRFILTIDVYFVAVTTVKDMALNVHIYFTYCPKPKNLKNQITVIYSVWWWKTYYQVACLSSNNKKFDALEKVVKMLMLNEKDGRPVKLEWFNHLPIYNKEDLPIEFKEAIFQNVLITQISRLNQKNCMRLKSIHLQVLSCKKL